MSAEIEAQLNAYGLRLWRRQWHMFDERVLNILDLLNGW